MSGSANDVLRRSVVLPVDLYADVSDVAQADGFQSVQAWVVVQLQQLVNPRLAELRDQQLRAFRARQRTA